MKRLLTLILIICSFSVGAQEDATLTFGEGGVSYLFNSSADVEYLQVHEQLDTTIFKTEIKGNEVHVYRKWTAHKPDYFPNCLVYGCDCHELVEYRELTIIKPNKDGSLSVTIRPGKSKEVERKVIEYETIWEY